MEILVYINGVKIGIKKYEFYEFMCGLKKDTEVKVDIFNYETILEFIPEFLPSISDKSYYGTVAGIKILHD